MGGYGRNLHTVSKKLEDLKRLIENEELNTTIIGQLLINLRYLTKHIAFKEELECRIVKIHCLNDSKIKTSNDFKQMYVEYLPVPIHIKKIYFGTNAKGMELFQDILTHNRLNIKCEKSKNTLA